MVFFVVSLSIKLKNHVYVPSDDCRAKGKGLQPCDLKHWEVCYRVPPGFHKDDDQSIQNQMEWSGLIYSIGFVTQTQVA